MSEQGRAPAMTGGQDFLAGIRDYSLWGTLAWWDIRSRYRRSVLGPLWLILSMGVLIGSLTMVYAWIFRIPLEEYIPYLTIGFVVWGYMSTLMNDSCRAFLEAQHLVRQANIPLMTLIMRVVARNVVAFLHTVVVAVVVLVAFAVPVGWNALYVIPGVLLMIISSIWVSLLIAMLSARYRDFPQALQNIIQMTFFLTPIIWLVPPERTPTFVKLNPFYHYLEIIRAPLLHDIPPAGLSWLVAVGLCVAGFAVAVPVFRRQRSRIIFWL